MALIVAVFGSQTDSQSLLFYSVFVCLYIGCNIKMYVVTHQSRACCWDFCRFTRQHGNSCSVMQTEWFEIWAGWVNLRYDVCRWEQTCKHLYGCAIPVLSSSSKALESRRFVKHKTRHTSYFLSFKLHYHQLCPAPWYFGDFRMTFKQH